ncbi:MAG: methyltransferase domain-containing protein [Candidatus Dependentiae bacterium]|nr:methyltransferase domain-containing protein [Candidatus Dependentiae bacterium]
MKQASLILIALISCISTSPATIQAALTLDSSLETLSQLSNANIWHSEIPLRLHLGCGENRFSGYVNIDYPPSEHTVQKTQAADVYANLMTLSMPQNSVDEIRSHHVFEHFDRQNALALLCKWYNWLKVDGTLVIETPDFDASIKMLTSSTYSYEQKQSVLRHVFGSHEAYWAVHWDGWYREKFKKILSTLGFENITFELTQWQLTRNIIVRATKKVNRDFQDVASKAKYILRDSMVDTSSSEENMWRIWCQLFDNALNQ